MKKRASRRVVSVEDAEREWWWFDNQCGLELDDVAESWELLRRTNYYQRCWEIVRHGRARHDLSSMFAALRAGRLAAKERARATRLAVEFWASVLTVVGGNIRSLLMAECDPNLSWSAFSQKQRDTVAFVSPFLPRQRSPEAEPGSRMQIGGGTVVRHNKDSISFVETWGMFPSQSQLPADFQRLLKSGKEQTFIVIEFGLDLGREALYTQLDELLQALLKPEQDLERSDLYRDDKGHLNWCEISDAVSRYPNSWPRPNPDLPRRRPQPQLIPSNWYPRAWCWFSTPISIAQVRTEFHTVLKNLRRLRPECLVTFKSEYDAFCEHPHPAKTDIAFDEFVKLNTHQHTKAFFRNRPGFALSALDCSLRSDEPASRFLIQKYLSTNEGSKAIPYHAKRRIALTNLRNGQVRTRARIAQLDLLLNKPLSHS